MNVEPIAIPTDVTEGDDPNESVQTFSGHGLEHDRIVVPKLRNEPNWPDSFGWHCGRDGTLLIREKWQLIQLPLIHNDSR